VLDLFGGSGSTLIAAEQSGRNAFLMEMDMPLLRRDCAALEQFTSKKAERVQGASAEDPVATATTVDG